MKRIAVVLALVALLAGCGGETGILPTTFIAEYEVSGTVTHANITYLNLNAYAGIRESQNAALPWSASAVGVLTGDEFYLSAQSTDDSGDLTVTVLVDGVPIATETTSTAFGFVAVYGTVP